MRVAASTAALVAAILFHAAPAAAQEVAPLTVDAILDGLVVEAPRGPVLMNDGELAEERGGFFSKEWAQGINFGAVLTTYINGKVAMATQLTLGSAGVQTTVTTNSAASTAAAAATGGAAPESASTAATANEPKQTATNTNNTITGQQEAAPPASTGSVAQQAAAAGINLNDELKSWNGVVVPGEGGGTAVLQSSDASRIAQVVLNTANGVNIQQNTNITMDIPGFVQLQQGFISDMMKNNIQGSLSSALGAALRR